MWTLLKKPLKSLTVKAFRVIGMSVDIVTDKYSTAIFELAQEQQILEQNGNGSFLRKRSYGYAA